MLQPPLRRLGVVIGILLALTTATGAWAQTSDEPSPTPITDYANSPEGLVCPWPSWILRLVLWPRPAVQHVDLGLERWARAVRCAGRLHDAGPDPGAADAHQRAGRPGHHHRAGHTP